MADLSVMICGFESRPSLRGALGKCAAAAWARDAAAARARITRFFDIWVVDCASLADEAIDLVGRLSNGVAGRQPRIVAVGLADKMNAAARDWLKPLGDAPDGEVLKAVFDFAEVRDQEAWQSRSPKVRETLIGAKAGFDALMPNGPLDVGRMRSAVDDAAHAIARCSALSDVLDAVKQHHNYTFVHSFKVASHLSAFSREWGGSASETRKMAMAGMVHDLGKLTIPVAILDKPAKLDPEEWEVMKSHVTNRVNVLDEVFSHVPEVKHVSTMHHEKRDGTGYPLGLKGNEIDELAALSAICDVFSALTDERSYKPALSVERSFEIMDEMSARSFDQRIYRKFKAMVA